MMRPSPRLGDVGLVPDLGRTHPLPLGAWKDGKNVRFRDGHIKRINDPALAIATVASDATWVQLYVDDVGPRVVYGTPTALYRLNLAGDAWEEVTRLSGPYTSGNWHSFPWGESVVFNNGVDVPQILTAGSANFVDLPNWGLLTSGQKTVTCASLRPFNTVMVAANVTIDGVNYPNMVWWSAPGVIDNNDANFNQPSWDYEDAGTLSGFNYVGVSSLPIVDTLTLDTSHMIYTRTSTWSMQIAGGRFVFAFRKRFDYGLARLGALTQYNNFHFVVSPSTIIRHDGSVLTHIADSRIEDDFYDNLSDLNGLKCTQDVINKEIHTLYENRNGKWEYLIYNYEADDNTWSKGDAEKDGVPVVCMAFGSEQDLDAETYNTITTNYATEQRTYRDVFPKSDKRRMYWLLEDKLMLAEETNVLDPAKEYFAESGLLSFQELGFTSNVSKQWADIYPHIEGPALTRFTISRAKTISNITNKGQRIRTFDPLTQDKAAFRASSRFFVVRVDIIGDGDWELLTWDYDVEADHGR